MTFCSALFHFHNGHWLTSKCNLPWKSLHVTYSTGHQRPPSEQIWTTSKLIGAVHPLRSFHHITVHLYFPQFQAEPESVHTQGLFKICLSMVFALVASVEKLLDVFLPCPSLFPIPGPRLSQGDFSNPCPNCLESINQMQILHPICDYTSQDL